MTVRRSWFTDGLLLFLLTAALIWPLFRLKYHARWYSIESTFISDARFLRDNGFTPQWQPNWYCGTRSQYVYPPALRLGTAAILASAQSMTAPRAYHIYIGLLYCLGIAGVYAFSRMAGRGRAACWSAAVLCALVAPALFLMPRVAGDDASRIPVRLWVLIAYGEGPHISSMAFLALALGFSLRAIAAWRPASLAMASLCAALVFAHNLYGGTSLFLLYPLLAWTLFWAHAGGWRQWARAAAIPLLALGWNAWWLTPSFLAITLRNMAFVARPPNAWSRWAFAALILTLAVAVALGVRRRAARAYPVFVLSGLALFSTVVLAAEFADFRAIGEAYRLVPELEWFLTLAFVLLLEQFSSRRWLVPAATAAICLAIGYPLRFPPWALFPRDWEPQERLEFQMANWVAKNRPEARTFTTGAVRFWFNAWKDLPQVGGGSEQGILNPLPLAAQYQLLEGYDGAFAARWLRIMGADLVIVHDRQSREHYKDYRHPEKFGPEFPVLFDDRKGSRILAVPRTAPGLARAVNRADLSGIPALWPAHEPADLERYEAAVETKPPLALSWQGTDRLRVEAPADVKSDVSVRISYDPAWTATLNGRRLAVQPDPAGFLLIDHPGELGAIWLQFETPAEVKAGRAAAALVLLTALFLCRLGLRMRKYEA